jgi:hypothetical protein
LQGKKESQSIAIGKEITSYLSNKVFPSLISIFLCGPSNNEKAKESNIRNIIRDQLKNYKYIYSFQVFYPEDIFMDFIYGHEGDNLLELENRLACSVDHVVIILKGPGALVELGAFSNNDLMKDKLVIINDIKEKKSKSFINYGVIRYLEKRTDSRVLWYDISAFGSENSKEEIGKGIIKEIIAKQKIFQTEKIQCNLFHMVLVMLCIIIIFDPIDKDFLVKIIRASNIYNETNDEWLSRTALNFIINKKMAIYFNKKYCITETGAGYIKKIFASQGKQEDLNRKIQNLRFKSLNITLRTKR